MVGRSEEIVAAGSHVMVVIDRDTPTAPLVRLAGRLAEPDGGRVSAVLVVPTGAPRPADDELARIVQHIATAGIDSELLVRVDDSIDEGVIHTAHSEHATLLVISADVCAVPSDVPTVVVGRTGADGVEHHRLPESIVARLAVLGLGPRSAV
jgi:K+-sensing histidine kinase KdpD